MKTEILGGGCIKRFNPNRVVRNLLNISPEPQRHVPQSATVNLEGVKPYDVFEDVKQGVVKFNLPNGHKKKILSEEQIERMTY